jgi:hypothetical protein
MSKCSYCGNENTAGSAYCFHCGAALQKPAESRAPKIRPHLPTTSQKTPLTKPCIACAEEIQEAAKLCRFCRTHQDDAEYLDSRGAEPIASQNYNPGLPLESQIGTANFEGNTSQGTPSERRKSRKVQVFLICLSVGVVLLLTQLFASFWPFWLNYRAAESIQSQGPVAVSPAAKPAPTEVSLGKAWMNFAISELNSRDPSGDWYEDPFELEIGKSVGVLLDDYSEYPAGCAVWWFDSKEDLESDLDEGNVNLFSEYYQWSWWETGGAFLIVVNEPSDSCFKNFVSIMEVEDFLN